MYINYLCSALAAEIFVNSDSDDSDDCGDWVQHDDNFKKEKQNLYFNQITNQLNKITKNIQILFL